MINEGNSLRELQERVLLASRHETKSESSYRERWSPSALRLARKYSWMLMPRRSGMSDRALALSLTFPRITTTTSQWPVVTHSPGPSMPKLSVYDVKESARATSVAGSLRGARADLIIIDDITP